MAGKISDLQLEVPDESALAYSIAQAARRCNLSERTLRGYIAREHFDGGSDAPHSGCRRPRPRAWCIGYESCEAAAPIGSRSSGQG